MLVTKNTKPKYEKIKFHYLRISLMKPENRQQYKQTKKNMGDEVL